MPLDRRMGIRVTALALCGTGALASMVFLVGRGWDSGNGGDEDWQAGPRPAEGPGEPESAPLIEDQLLYRVDLVERGYSVMGGDVLRDDVDVTASIHCRLEPVSGSAARLSFLEIGRQPPPSFTRQALDRQLLAHPLSFRVERDSAISLDPAPRGSDPRSVYGRALLRLFVPLSKGPGEFVELEENTIHGVVAYKGRREKTSWTIHVDRVSDEVSPGAPGLIVFHSFDPRPLDIWGASRLYAGGWLPDALGLARVSYLRLRQGSESTAADHCGVDLSATCRREPGSPADEANLARLREVVDAHMERMWREVPSDWTASPPGVPEGWVDPPEKPGSLLPLPIEVRTDSYGSIAEALSETARHCVEDRNYLFVIEVLARVAAVDLLVRDRLFEIAHDADDLSIRRLALFALGMTTDSSVRLALLEFAGSTEVPESLRTDALRAVFMERSAGVTITAGRIDTYIDGVKDPSVLRAVLDWRAGRDLPEGAKLALIYGLGSSQQTVDPEDLELVAGAVRAMYLEEDSIDLKARALGTVSAGLSLENWRLIFGELSSDSPAVRNAALFAIDNFGRSRSVDHGLEQTMARDLLDRVDGMGLTGDRARLLRKVPVDSATVAEYTEAVRTQMLRPLVEGELPIHRSLERVQLVQAMRNTVRDARAAREVTQLLRDLRARLEDDAEAIRQLDFTVEMLRRR